MPYAVYHESGERLHNFGDLLNSKHTFLMEEAGIEEVVTADKFERPQRIKADLAIKKSAPQGLKRSDVVVRPVYADDGTLIVESGKAISEDVVQFLLKNEIEYVWVEKSNPELKLGQVAKYKKLIQKHIEEKKPIPNFEDASFKDNLLSMARDYAIVNELEKRGPESLVAKVKGPPLNGLLPKLNPARLRTPKELEAQLKLYESCAKRIQLLFSNLAHETPVKLADIDAVVADMLKAVLRDRALLLAIMHQQREGEYLYNHTVNVFTLSVNLAILLGYDEPLLKELAYAAFFNACGMLLVPDEIRNKSGKLDKSEAAEIQNHTTYSVRLASRVSGIPEMLPLIIFQSHELMDGKGYPRKKPGEEIHELARVIAVADVYSAMISNRPYRRGEQPYRALEEVIKLAGQRKYDANVVRALLKAVNLFPVGTWVRLSDQSLGVVVCPNQEEYARPFVRSVYRAGKRVPGFPLVDQSAISIASAITPPGGSSALAAFCRFD